MAAAEKGPGLNDMGGPLLFFVPKIPNQLQSLSLHFKVSVATVLSISFYSKIKHAGGNT